MYDRRWKTKFFFVSGFWAGNPVEVGRDPFPPYTSEMENLCPEGMLLFTTRIFFFFWVISTNSLFFFLTAVRRPSLSKFYLEHDQ